MAAISKSGTPSLATALPPQNEQIPGLRTGENIGGGDLCTVASTGLVMLRTTGPVHGVAALPASNGEAVTLYRNVRFGYGVALIPGSLVYPSATVPGGLDTAGTAGTDIGWVVDTTRIQFSGL